MHCLVVCWERGDSLNINSRSKVVGAGVDHNSSTSYVPGREIVATVSEPENPPLSPITKGEKCVNNIDVGVSQDGRRDVAQVARVALLGVARENHLERVSKTCQVPHKL